MSNFNLGLPVDIPWKRVCVTDDMIHVDICSLDKLPVPFHHSIAVFAYDPSDADKIIPGDVWSVRFYKVSTSLTPYHIPDGSSSSGYLPDDLTDTTAPNAPCYGALLQVSVGPTSSEVPKSDYPYFSDFEPKKRQVYEAVSSSGEESSGTTDSLSVGKGATNSANTENYDLRTGYSKSMSAQVGGFGVSAGASYAESQSGQWGSVGKNAFQSTQNQNSDTSTDRRETQSHTTAMTQMYTLFQAYHVGTNRAMFFIGPTPHTISSAVTFINGPREIEGIQDIFFVVAYKTGQSICVSVHLESVHYLLGQTEPKSKVDTETFYFDSSDLSSWNQTYTPDPEWKIDVDKTLKPIEDAWVNGLHDISFDVSRSMIKIHCSGLRAGTRDERAIQIFLRETIDHWQAHSVFHICRDLCCCGGGTSKPVYVGAVNRATPTMQRIALQMGPATPQALLDSIQLSKETKQLMFSTIGSVNRFEPGAVLPESSDIMFHGVVNALQKAGLTTEINKDISASAAIPTAQRDQLVQNIGSISVGDLVQMNTPTLASKSGLTVSEVLTMKDQILRFTKPLPPTVVDVTPLRKIIGVRIRSTYPDPVNTKLLVEMKSPRDIIDTQIVDNPNVIEVDFSARPDDGTVTTSSFTVFKRGSAVATDLQWVTTTRARLIITAALEANAIYTVALHGTTSPAITFDSVKLDGDPFALPSGDGVAGGDFVFAMRVNAALPQPVIPTPPSVLIDLIGLRMRSTNPDPINPILLMEVMTPTLVPSFTLAMKPDVIDVDFNVTPDATTVTTSSVLVTSPTGGVTYTVSSLSATTFRIAITSTLVAGQRINIALKGTGAHIITYSGRALDGAPLRFPTGTGTAGSDFTFSYNVTA